MPWRTGATILVVEDDGATAHLLCSLLERSGHTTLTAAGGREALRLLCAPPGPAPSLILLDLMLPDIDGLILLGEIRHLCRTPVVVCTATLRKRDALLALRLGADDVITKPFDPQELHERLAAVLRRSAAAPSDRGAPDDHRHAVRRVGSLALDQEKHELHLAQGPLHLTPIERRLLFAFAERPNTVLTRDVLARTGWGDSAATVGRALDVHIRRLRFKLAQRGALDLDIVTVRTIGYRLVCRGEALTARELPVETAGTGGAALPLHTLLQSAQKRAL
ncbi:MAG TPA: response regulator transcription factor [Chloroflexota bacterium]|nr:response regulator transcription factor [Chloroflexota bacterium]